MAGYFLKMAAPLGKAVVKGVAKRGDDAAEFLPFAAKSGPASNNVLLPDEMKEFFQPSMPTAIDKLRSLANDLGFHDAPRYPAVKDMADRNVRMILNKRFDEGDYSSLSPLHRILTDAENEFAKRGTARALVDDSLTRPNTMTGVPPWVATTHMSGPAGSRILVDSYPAMADLVRGGGRRSPVRNLLNELYGHQTGQYVSGSRTIPSDPYGMPLPWGGSNPNPYAFLGPFDRYNPDFPGRMLRNPLDQPKTTLDKLIDRGYNEEDLYDDMMDM